MDVERNRAVDMPLRPRQFLLVDKWDALALGDPRSLLVDWSGQLDKGRKGTQDRRGQN